MYFFFSLWPLLFPSFGVEHVSNRNYKSLEKMIDWLLKILGWYCDPDEALPVPTRDRPRQTGVTVPKNISFDSTGRAFKVSHVTDGLVAEEVTLGRTAGRTPGDEYVLGLTPPEGKPALNPNKYFRLKTFWAKGLSAKATADCLKTERGYSIRTVEYYWACFAVSQRHGIEKIEN